MPGRVCFQVVRHDEQVCVRDERIAPPGCSTMKSFESRCRTANFDSATDCDGAGRGAGFPSGRME
jgi:hypothetical protein